jgi:hypothetical protein
MTYQKICLKRLKRKKDFLQIFCKDFRLINAKEFLGMQNISFAELLGLKSKIQHLHAETISRII